MVCVCGGVGVVGVRAEASNEAGQGLGDGTSRRPAPLPDTGAIQPASLLVTGTEGAAPNGHCLPVAFPTPQPPHPPPKKQAGALPSLSEEREV